MDKRYKAVFNAAKGAATKRAKKITLPSFNLPEAQARLTDLSARLAKFAPSKDRSVEK